MERFNRVMTVSSLQLLQPQLAGVTRRFQGADGLLGYRFTPGTDVALSQRMELVLLRLDAQLELDLQIQPSNAPAAVVIQPFASSEGVDPLTGRPTLNVGKSTPDETSWTIEWAETGPIPAQEVLVHEWGHVLGLGHPDSSNPFSTASNTAHTVMSYNRNASAPGRNFTPTDLEALAILWEAETTPPSERHAFFPSEAAVSDPSLSNRLQQLLDQEPANPIYINSVYELVLQRPVDAPSATAWNAALDFGLHRGELIQQLLLSDELGALLQTPI